MPAKKQFFREQKQAEPEQGVTHITIGEGANALHIAYLPNMISASTLHALTLPAQAVDALTAAIQSSVVEWDLQDEDDGPVIPLTLEAVGTVEVPILQLIFDAILGQVSMGEANGTPSSAPTKPPSLPEA